MTPNEILNIVKAFFDAILRVLTALGFVKEEGTEDGSEEVTE